MKIKLDKSANRVYICPVCKAESTAEAWNRATERDFGGPFRSIENPEDELTQYTCPKCNSVSESYELRYYTVDKEEVHMNQLKKWSKTFCDEEVMFLKGDFTGETGIFERCTGYTGGYGMVGKIYIPSLQESREFTADFFEFTEDEVKRKWEEEE